MYIHDKYYGYRVLKNDTWPARARLQSNLPQQTQSTTNNIQNQRREKSAKNRHLQIMHDNNIVIVQLQSTGNINCAITLQLQ